MANTWSGERADVARLAKSVNAQMRKLERAGYTRSPAYKTAQAWLTAMGAKPTKSGGRRFPESYRSVSEDDFLAYQHAIEQMKEAPTGTVQGYREYYSEVFEAANRRYNLDGMGVSQDAYFKMWEEMPDKEKDRVYGSDVYIRILKAYSSKYGDAGELTGADIAERVNAAGSFLGALKSVGINMGEYRRYGGLE